MDSLNSADLGTGPDTGSRSGALSSVRGAHGPTQLLQQNRDRRGPPYGRSHAAMSALAGGGADKLGNRYEHWWVAGRIADLLDGIASRLRLEPPGDDGVGVELDIDLGGEAWGEQTKDQIATWTINRLGTDEVLAAIKHQVGLGRRYRFVTSSAATSLETLSERARALMFDEFDKELTTKLADDFADLVKHWNANREETWKLLQHVAVQQHSFASLQQTVRVAYKLHYADDPDVVVETLRGFCEDNLHQTITAPQVAAHLEAKGLRARRLAYDTNTRRELHRTVERHQRRVDRAAPSFGLLDRRETQDILATLRDPEAPQVVIVDGAAGFGKSAVAAGVASQLEADGWFVAVARMDVDTAALTSGQLGQRMDLDESPTVLLGGVADGSPALLVIDQLDAVSLFSGRMPDSFDAVEEALAEGQNLPNVKVLLVSRSVDLNNDQRLRTLLRNDRAARHTLAKLDADQIRSHLADHGVHVPSHDTIELLRTPLHLAVYERLSDDARQQPYRTLQELYGQLTIEIRRRAAQRAERLDWTAITSTLVNHMSDHETLTAPRSALERFPPEDIAALESEAAIVSDSTGVTFFHESYFDYLFARAFINGGGDLHAFLSTKGQFLFRRAQARQVLDHLAATDRDAFRRAAAELLAADDIRSHLKHVVVEILRQITPTPEDWEAMEDVAWSDAPIGRHLITLLSSPAWFDAVDALGRWEQWLADEARIAAAAHQIVFAARQRGERVAELVRPHVGTTDDWRYRLSALISWSINTALVPLAIELIEGGHVDDARGPIAINSDFWSIVHFLEDDDPAGAARLAGAWLRRGLARANADGGIDPFESEHLDTHSQTADVLRDIAQKAPAAYIEEILPFVVDVEMATRRDRDELLPVGHWRYQHRDANHGVDDIAFAALADALQLLAAKDPTAARTAIEPLRHLESAELRLLVCQTLTALDDPDDAIDWLLADTRNLVLGWIDSPHWASRALLNAHSSTCADALYRRLEDAILNYRTKYAGSATPHGQYDLLTGLDPNRLTDGARRRLGELQRRYPNSPPAEPKPIMGSFVRAPIPPDASKHMSDDQWLGALHKHNTEKTDWRGDIPVGGASQLASVLGDRAAEEPERFARLALRFDESIPAVAIAQIIRHVHANISHDLLTDVCAHAQQLYGDDSSVGRASCDAIANAQVSTETALGLLKRYARSNDPDREWARTDAGNGTPYFGGDLHSAGLNSTRGEAAQALGQLLSVVNDIYCLIPAIQDLARDPNLGVRVMAAEPVVLLERHSPEITFDIAEQLFDAPVDIFGTGNTELLLIRALRYDPDRFAAHLARALDGPPEVATRAGSIWAIAEHQDLLRPPVPTDFASLNTPARVGAAGTIAYNLADTADRIGLIFDDPDPEVRGEAAGAMRHLSDVPPEQLDALLAQFRASAAFADHVDDVIDGLEALGATLPPATLRICDAAVDVAGGDLGDISTARAAVSGDLIGIVLRLYRQGDAATRSSCLDVIDRLADLNAYRIFDALAEER